MDKTMVKSAFQVVEAGPWDSGSFKTVDVTVVSTTDGLEARVEERQGGLCVEFTIDDFERKGNRLILRTNAARKWVFQALD